MRTPRAHMRNSDRLIKLIYDGVEDETAWTAALAMIARSTRAAGAGLGVQNMRTHAFWAVAQSGVDPALHETYERLAPQNRIWQSINTSGRPTADQMVMPKSEFVRTPLHAEWFVPQGFHSVMAAPVLANGDHCGVVVAFGSERRGDFEAAELSLLAGIAGHLSQAIGLRLDRVRLTEALRARDDVLEDMDDGILFLSGQLQVQHANKMGQALLDRRDAFVLRAGRLACRDPGDDAELQKALVSAVLAGHPPAGGWVVVRRSSRRPLLAQVRRWFGGELARLAGDGLIVVRIRDPDQARSPAPALLQRLLGVTPAEARALIEIARSQSQDEAARRLGVSKATVRTQLHSAYHKLGLHDRADLLRLLGAYGFRPGG